MRSNKSLKAILCLITAINLYSAYPEELQVDVVYYDFHSDGSNPDFNPGVANDSLVKGLVKDQLNSNGNPESTDKMFYSKNIARWFVPWKDNGTLPHYSYGGWGLDWEENTDGTDTSYKSIMLKDSLLFKHISDGVYQFSSKSFFPIDGKGFGNEKTLNWDNTYVYNHNYSFVMKLEKDFVYRKGLTFEFKGDDDVWVFINNKLALDLGGCHPALDGSFSLDNNAGAFGLELGKSYPISFFFAERQADGSNCTITTNIISAPPSNLQILVSPNDTIHVSDTAFLSAYIDSDTGRVTELAGQIEWGLIDPENVNPVSTLNSVDVLNSTFVPIKAHTTVTVWGRYFDPQEGDVFTDTVQITVLPGKMDHIVIEASPDKPDAGSSALWEDSHLNMVTIFDDDTTAEGFFVIARDVQGNWIGPVKWQDIDKWESGDSYIASAANGADSAQGEGKAIRGGSPLGGDTWIKVVVADSLTDNIAVHVTPMYRVEVFPYPSPAPAGEFIDIELEPLAGIKGMAFLFQMVGIVGNFIQPEEVRADIFDVTGNLVNSLVLYGADIPFSNSLEYKHNGNVVRGLAVLPWDCMNSSGRSVASGSYVAKISYKDNCGIEKKYRITIGVK